MLVSPVEPNVEVTEEQVRDVPTLARMLAQVIRTVVTLGRRMSPRRIDHEGLVMNGDGSTQYILPHGFGGEVRWWTVDCTSGVPAIYRDTFASTSDVLVLISTSACTVTIRVEEVGG
jgi:hypothetical protein